MFILFERSLLGETIPFYRMSKLIFVQKLSHFEGLDFAKISDEKIRTNSIWDILDRFELACQSLSYESKICTISSLTQDKNF